MSNRTAAASLPATSSQSLLRNVPPLFQFQIIPASAYHKKQEILAQRRWWRKEEDAKDKRHSTA
jgi:hypothetical protein